MSFYPFLGNTYLRFMDIVKSEEAYIRLKETYQIYEICKKQYLGLGVLLQFWPGTNANLARKQLIKTLEDDVGALLSLPEYPNLSIVDDFIYFIGFGFGFKEADENSQFSILKILSCLPLVHSFFPDYINPGYVPKDWKTFLSQGSFNLLSSILNPTEIIYTTLLFIHFVLNRLVEIGDEGKYSSTPRRFLKSLIGVVLGICKMPVAILHGLIYGIWSMFIQPIMHFGKSLLQLTYTATEKQAFIASVQEMRDVKELRQAAKGRKVDYSIIPDKRDFQTQYFADTKKGIYSPEKSKEAVENTVIAVLAPKKPEKTYKLYQLLAIHGAYKAKGISAQHDARAIAEAKVVLGC